MTPPLKDICPHDDCTGCLACANACAHAAIVVTEDELGFRYPKINTGACTGCGLCSRVCPALHPTAKLFPSECFAFAVGEPEELLSVASGGAATAMGAFVVSDGGVVYGCSGDDMRAVSHVRVDSPDGLERLKGSKYVQSDMGLIYRAVRADLARGLRVLFIGTPCQVGGLQSFLGRAYDRLITADIVCHGVPSQRLLNDAIDHYRRRYPGLDESSVRFRRKAAFGTHGASIKYAFCFRPSPDADEVAVRWYDDPFMLGFLGAATMRSSCYTCPYAYNVRGADLTLSDFWGLGGDAGFRCGDGVSSLLVNTPRGAEFLEAFRAGAGGFRLTPRRVQESITGNQQLMCPTPASPAVARFRAAYPEQGLGAIFEILRKKRFKHRALHLLSPLLNRLHL